MNEFNQNNDRNEILINSKSMLIDTHAHLTDASYDPNSQYFSGISAQDIIDNMTLNGLSNIVSVGYDVESSEKSKIIAEKHGKIYYAPGIHPSESYKVSGDYLEKIFQFTKSNKCVAVGEIGLDYHYEDTDVQSQKKILLEQMDLCGQADLPVIFHVRDAYGDMIEIVKNNLQLLPRRGIMHCFSGSKETALEYIKMGFYISFSGSVTFKNAVKFPEILTALPRDRVLIETDCPYLAPVPYRGKTNYPAYVKYQAEKVAEVWGISYDEVAKITSDNARLLLNII